MGFLDFFRTKETSPDLEHPVFGALFLETNRRGSYWIHEPDIDGEICITVATRDNAPPSVAQTAFYQNAIRDLDVLFDRAATLVRDDYVRFFRQPLPAQWRSVFRFSGLGIPLDGDERNPWDVCFTCLTNDSGHLFTCYFRDGLPSHVSVDT